MATIRSLRIGNENIKSINELEEFVNNNYLQQIQDKIQQIRDKKRLIQEKLDLYNSINSTNALLKEQLLTDIKYTTIVSNQQEANTLLEDFNKVLKQLTIILSYKDFITTNNLLHKQDLYDNNKVSIVEGEFTTLEVIKPTSIKGAINREFLTKELLKLEQPPKPYQPLKYLATDEGGNLIWKA